MRVVVHPADLGGCGWYRLRFVSDVLANQGHDVCVEYDRTYSCRWMDTVFGDKLVGLEEIPDADVVILQRPLTRHRYELVGALQDAGLAVVVEIDDDFHAIDRRNPAWHFANPLRDPDTHRDWLMRACDRADLVTVTTSALAQRYGAHGRVAILDNYVPARYLDVVREPHPGIVVGWSGSTLTHPGDLEVTDTAITEAIGAIKGCRLGVVGTGVGVATALGYGGRMSASGWVPIEEYPDALGQLDVGLVPLKPNPFNEAKSHLKGLEYAAVGVPFVATPTGPYRRLAAEGIGWLAESPAEWRYLVSELAQDALHREALGEQWRAAVADRWTVEQNAHLWWEAWEAALAHRHERVAA